MSYFDHQTIQSMTVTVRTVEVLVKGVTFYPSEAATEIDPPEPAIVEWEQVFIGGVDVSEMFCADLREDLWDALINQLEFA